MSDITCSYKIDNQTEQSYFLMERNASFLQFVQFLHSSSIIDQSYSIYHLNNVIDSEESFNSMLNTNHAGDIIELIFKNKNQPEPPVVSVEKEVAEPEFGETIKIIAEKIGVKLEKIPERPRELIESLPFPHKCVIKQFIKRIRHKENEIEAIVQQAANFYNVDAHLLLQEVQQVIQYYKERRNMRKSCEVKQNKQEIQEKQLIGENIQKILNELHLDYSDINSPGDLDRLIAQLPQPMARLVNMKLARVAENPNKLKWISKRLAKRFNLPEEKLLEEADHLVKQYMHSKKEVNARVSEHNQTGVENKPEFHPARCDSCTNRIQGIRYWCLNCRNYDLCSACEEKNGKENFHDENHIFAKIKQRTTMYRVFPGAMHQGIRSRTHGKNSGMEKKIAKEQPVEERLKSLEETVKLLEEMVKKIENK
jgi:hypothetical protein